MAYYKKNQHNKKIKKYSNRRRSRRLRRGSRWGAINYCKIDDSNCEKCRICEKCSICKETPLEKIRMVLLIISASLFIICILLFLFMVIYIKIRKKDSI